MKESNDRGTTVTRTVHSPNIARISSFSDAVFAVAITLLILYVEVPRVPAGSVETELPKRLASMGHEYFVYVMSFFIIGFFWIVHHRIFRFVKRYNEIFIWINILLLMLIVFIPFSMNLNTTYRTSKVAFWVYAVNLGLVSIVIGLQWLYAIRGRRLTGVEMEPDEARRSLWESFITAILIFASIGMSFVNLWAARAFLSCVFLADFVIDILGGKRKFRVFD